MEMVGSPAAGKNKNRVRHPDAPLPKSTDDSGMYNRAFPVAEFP